MDASLALALLVSLFSVTLGCVAVRLLLMVSYNVLAIIWCMAVFAGVVLGFALQKIGVGTFETIALISVSPFAAYYGHGTQAEPSSSVYWARLYGALLLAVAAILALNVQRFRQVLSPVWEADQFESAFMSVTGLLVLNAILVILRAKK